MAISPHTEPAAAPPVDGVVREVKPTPTPSPDAKPSPALRNVVEITEKYRTVRLLVVVGGVVVGLAVLSDVLLKIVDQPPYSKVALGTLAILCGPGGALSMWLKHRRQILMRSAPQGRSTGTASTSAKEVP